MEKVIIIFFFLGMYVVVIGMYRDFINRAKELYDKCTLTVWADVVDVKKVPKQDMGNDDIEYRLYWYIPTLRFDYNLETVEKVCHETNDIHNKYIVGNKVKIHIDPENINNMLFDDVEKETRLRRGRILFIIVISALSLANIVSICSMFGIIK